MSENNQTSHNSLFVLLLVLLGVGAMLLAPNDRQLSKRAEQARREAAWDDCHGYTDAQINRYAAEWGCSVNEVKNLIRKTGGR